MPALKATGFTARITWLGRVADRDAALNSAPADRLTLSFAGPEGEAHGGRTRPSDSRVLDLHPRDTEIANVRQLSVLSAEEMAETAERMGIDALNPEWLGASMVLEGLPDFSRLPPSSRLQGPDGCTLIVDMENRPCNLPARVIEKLMPGVGKTFKTAAAGRRGVTAWVERPGTLRAGDTLRLFIPDQRPWTHLPEARNS
ncbi:MOSC domain-containing protein [Acidimangrovimonas sediminis]|uniref:MOSC domain-containing protein n=1 Tax=Acidimangrovimonas sediminis TaxID=2056283 RepID=UPI000C808775|nr:MOSC domain-containing protein [Acidimangrovimonas sediminis]